MPKNAIYEHERGTAQKRGKKMKTFKDYSGEEAIDVVIAASQYITPLITDKDVMGDLENMDVGKIGAIAIKNHPKECEELRKALGNEPAESALGAAYGISQILIEVITDKDVLDFFKSMNKTQTQSTSVMENTEEEG